MARNFIYYFTKLKILNSVLLLKGFMKHKQSAINKLCAALKLALYTVKSVF